MSPSSSLLFPTLSKIFLDLCFPPICAGCQRLGTWLCPDCFSQIEFWFEPITLTLPDQHLDEVWTVAKYQGIWQKIIHSYKFTGIRALGRSLARLTYFMYPHLTADLITAVPLHQRRLLERGFNQSQVLANHFHNLASIPIIDLLSRTEYLTPQASVTSRSERLARIKGNFEIDTVGLIQLSDQANHHPATHQPITSVILIDDVITTGATLNEAAKVLRSLNFSRVIGLTLAHGL